MFLIAGRSGRGRAGSSAHQVSHCENRLCFQSTHTRRRRSGVNLAQVLRRASAKQMRTDPSLKSSFQPDKFKQSNFRPNCTCSADVPSSAASSRKTTICRVIRLKRAWSLAAVGRRAKLMHLAAHACLFATRSLGINAVLILRLPNECFVRNVCLSVKGKQPQCGLCNTGIRPKCLLKNKVCDIKCFCYWKQIQHSVSLANLIHN